ncbi:MAG: hypothetical protein EBR82_54165 [Caulobacteraceae bacterium]|nr:hypothetical protein [Caulobacteraceae bacterium]
MSYTVVLPNGEEVDVDAPDEKAAAQAARQYYSRQGGAQPSAAPSASPGKTPIPQAAAAGFANGVLVGAGPKIAARNEAIGRAVGRGDFVDAGSKALGYLTAPGRAIYKLAGRPDLAVDASDDPQFAGRRNQFEDAFQKAATDRPVTTFAGNAAAALVPIVGQSNKALTFGGRVAEGAKTGGLFGALYGLNSAPEGEERERVASGALAGAAFGAGIPVATKAAGMFGGAVKDAALRSDTVRGALNAIDDELYRRPLIGGNLNMSMGVPAIPPRSRPGRATPRFNPPANYVARRAAQFADRGGLNASQLDERIAAAQADPRGRTMAELFGQPGVDAAATISRMPGQTGQLARTQLTDRIRGSGQRLMNDLTGEPGADAVQVFNDRARTAAAQYLRPALEQNVTPEMQAASGQALQRLMARRSVADAVEMAQGDIAELIQTGDLPPSAIEDPAYLLHYAKMAIARSIKDPNALPSGKPKLDNMLLTRAAKDITTTLEQIRPGYAKAMDELQRVLRPRGVAEDITMMRGKQPNVAGRLLGDPAVRRELGKPGLENFGQALRAEDEMFGDAVRMMPSTNSITSNAMFGAMDEAAMGMSNIPASKEGVLSAALNYWRAGVNETKRNEVGRFLLRQIDDPESGLSAQERQGIADELMRIHRARQTQTAATRAGARAAAAQVNTLQGR